MGKQYTVRAFAALAGVTPKALRHYDRIGLLKPRRTAAGYRVYVERDLERLEQIAALSFVGLPLKDIRRLLDGPPRSLGSALHAQRAVLEEKRRLLDVAVEAIRDTERLLAAGHTLDAALLKGLMEAIDMQNHVDALKQYFSNEAWTTLSRLREKHDGERTSVVASWSALFREAESLLAEDPESPKAQEFGDRWLRHWEQTTGGNAGVAAGMRTAWADRENWPPEVRDRVAGLSNPAVADFVTMVLAAWMKRYYSEDAWARKRAMGRAGSDQARTGSDLAWTRLFEEARSLLDEDPAGDKGQDLAARWCELWDASTGGDAQIHAAMRRAWMDRERWPLPMRQHVDNLGVPLVADWIGRALAARAGKS
ncbi:MAG TPA: MerR family transcriptional regulator [Vicinamibacterales bacterium]